MPQSLLFLSLIYLINHLTNFCKHFPSQKVLRYECTNWKKYFPSTECLLKYIEVYNQDCTTIKLCEKKPLSNFTSLMLNNKITKKTEF